MRGGGVTWRHTPLLGYRFCMAEARYDMEWDGERLVVEGQVPPGSGEAFADALRDAARNVMVAWGTLDLDLFDLEIEDGVSMAQTITAIRDIQAWHPRMVLHGAPQMLAHTLYKVGMLEDGALVLREPREDEGSTAN